MVHPTPAEHPTSEERFAEKARVLIELFGPSGMERLSKSGLDPKLQAILERAAQSARDGTTGKTSTEGLLKRFRDQGFLNAQAQAPAGQDRPRQARNAKTPPAPRPSEPRPSSAAAVIADALSEATLEQEHPAVIAMVLRGQPAAIRSRVLKALPGPCARATMRQLKNFG